jgi:hypothetical protein
MQNSRLGAVSVNSRVTKYSGETEEWAGRYLRSAASFTSQVPHDTDLLRHRAPATHTSPYLGRNARRHF